MFNKKERLFLAIVAIILMAVVISLGVLSSKAEADQNDVMRRPMSCDYRGDVVAYVHLGDHIPVEDIIGSPDTFSEFRCYNNGMRIYKGRANTRHEVVTMRTFVKEIKNEEYPILFCLRDFSHAKIFDLAYFWGLPGIHALNKPELNRYTKWAHWYKRKVGCRVFNDNGRGVVQHHRSVR